MSYIIQCVNFNKGVFMNLKERVISRLKNADHDEIIKVANRLGMLREGWVRVESSASGDYVPTAFGDVYHTNGHFSIGSSKAFWFGPETESFAIQTDIGDPCRCGVAKFHVKNLEEWYKKHLAE